MMDGLAEFIGKIARPLAIVMTALAASISCVVVAFRSTSGSDGAAAMWAIGALVGGVYGFKAAEEAVKAVRGK